MRLIGLAVVLAPIMVLAPMAVDAEPAGEIHRIGFIGFQSPGLESRMIGSFQDRLAELGYVNGATRRSHTGGPTGTSRNIPRLPKIWSVRNSM
jgi:hypothetical protein